VSLPHAEDLKAYNRVESDVEDDLFGDLVDTATAFVQQYLRVPLEATARTFSGRWPRRGPRREPQEQLTVPVYPCATTATITDGVGDTVTSSLYAIDGRSGQINAVLYEAFNRPPYTVAINVGYATASDYNDVIEPLLRQAILWVGSDLYRRRNPGAIYEQSGGQVSITYTEDALPPVIRMKLEVLRPASRIW
jgi:hypothetical protein